MQVRPEAKVLFIHLAAPEVLQAYLNNAVVFKVSNFASDVYSFGVVIVRGTIITCLTLSVGIVGEKASVGQYP